MTSLLFLLWGALLVTFFIGLILGYFWGKGCCRKSQDVCTKSDGEIQGQDIVEIDPKLDGEGYAIETLEGIGKHTGQRFRNIGIASVGDVLRQMQTPEQRQSMAETLGMKVSVLDEWASMADFLRIDTMDHQFAELATASGITTVSSLAKQHAKSLTKTMAKTNQGGRQLIAPTDPIESDVTTWIDTAKKMKTVIQA